MTTLNTKRGFGKIWVIIIIFLLLLIGVYLLLAINWWPSNSISNGSPTSTTESLNIITIDMQANASEAKVSEIKKLLENQRAVQSVLYFSPGQVLEENKSNNPDYFSNPNVLQTLDELGNPFGPRLVVKINDPSQKQTLIEFIQANDTTPFSMIQLVK